MCFEINLNWFNFLNLNLFFVRIYKSSVTTRKDGRYNAGDLKLKNERNSTTRLCIEEKDLQQFNSPQVKSFSRKTVILK